jgi:hypothetical protein
MDRLAVRGPESSRAPTGRHEDDIETAAAGRGLEASPGAPVADVARAPLRRLDLASLQRSAGNRAVAGLVAGRSAAGMAPANGTPANGTAANGTAAGQHGLRARALMLAIQRLCIEDEAPPGGAPGGAVTGERIGEGEGALEGQTGPAAAPGTAPDVSTKPTLRRGSRGPSVIELQGRLNDRNVADPALDPDGIFGRLTKDAVITFQTDQGLVPDGIVGPLTWGALLSGGGETPPVDPLQGLPVQVLGHGASEAAVAAARQAAVELFGDLTVPSRAQLMTQQVALDVIPHDKQLTDLPEYAHLKGTNTFDGRLWDTVRGIQTTIAGVHRFAIAEDDLISVPGTAASYGDGFLAAHEGGHALQASGLTPAQISTLTALHTARLAASGPLTPTTPPGAATAMWLNPAWYSAANKEEYFGNSVAAYLGHPYTNGDADRAQYTQTWLAANDPGMLSLLRTVFAH